MNIVPRLKPMLRRLLGRPAVQRALMRDDPHYAAYSIGRGTYGSPSVQDWNDGTKLTIGQYTSIADGVTILLGGEHRTDWVSTYPFSALQPEHAHIKGHPHTRGNITIGSDVWIGYQAMLLSGVTIGHGAVIGARSVVTKSVEPYSIVAGMPARHIRYRFDESTRNALLAAAWWDLSDEQINQLVPLLMSPDTAALLEAIARTRAT